MKRIVALLFLAACGSSSSAVDGEDPDGGPSIDARATDGASGDASVSGDAAAPLDARDDSDATAGDAGCGATARLSEIQVAVFNGCSGIGPRTCHARAPFNGLLDLTAGNSYVSLVSHTSSRSRDRRVMPGDLDHSFLWRKLNNDLSFEEGEPMPLGEGIQWRPIPTDELNQIRCWILQGAPNN